MCGECSPCRRLVWVLGLQNCRTRQTRRTSDSSDGSFSATLRIPNARLWDIGKPHLYTLEVTVSNNGAVTDSYRQTFGVRTVQITGDQLLLNGRPVYLTGFGKHEDFAVLGRAQPDAVNVRDLELLKWTGANSFRTAHYPCASGMLDLADRLGILVISESPAVSMIPAHATAETLELHCQAIREQMRRDYNHPSVVLWCVANEAHSHTPEAVPYFEKVFATARAEDSTRPLLLVTCYWPDEKCHHLCDIVGVNSYPGWYGGGDKLENSAAWFSGFLDDVRARTGKPIMITEIGADAMAGLHSLPSSLWTEDYQTDLLETNLNVIREKDYIIGEHLWALCDFHTAQNHFRAHGNRKGLFTRERQPKAAAHMLRNRWRATRE
jgi:beta-glucuronidase